MNGSSSITDRRPGAGGVIRHPARSCPNPVINIAHAERMYFLELRQHSGTFRTEAICNASRFDDARATGRNARGETATVTA